MAAPRSLYARLLARPYLLLSIAALIWAGNAVAGRAAVGEMSPMVLTWLRWVIVVVVLAAIARPSVAAEWPALRRHWRLILVMGGAGFTVFNAFFYLGAQTTTAINIGMIQGTMPMLVMMGSFLAYRTPVTAWQLAGLAIGLVGIAVIASRGDLAHLTGAKLVIGDVWMLIACLFYAGYGVALRRRPAMSHLAFFTGLAAAAFLTAIPLVGVEIWSGTDLWPGPRGWGILLHVGLFPSLVAQVLFIRGVELIGPGRAGLFLNLVPIFSAVLGVALLGETFAGYHAVAMVLVLAGIALAEWGKPDADRT